MEFVNTKRGARALVCDGYKYVINRRGHDGRIFWRCGRSRGCSGSVCTLDDEILSRNDIHNHSSDEGELEAEKVVDTIRKKHGIQQGQYQLSIPRKYKQLPLDQTEKRLLQNYQH